MDQDTSTQKPDAMVGCGCTAGTDGGACDACKAGKHHECTSDTCKATDDDTPSEGSTADQA